MGCAGRVSPCSPPTGKAACFAPPKAGSALAEVVALLPFFPPAFTGPRVYGELGAAAPGQTPPFPQGAGHPASRPLGLSAGAAAGGGGGSPSGLAQGLRVPSLSLARSLSLSFSFE